jgi:multicomponent Na+:H+ antiporter subunit E
MRPGIIKIPVDVTTDQELLALVNLVTMTPGTLSLDLSEDKKYLYIHAMYMKNPEVFHADIKSLEKMIKRVF